MQALFSGIAKSTDYVWRLAKQKPNKQNILSQFKSSHQRCIKNLFLKVQYTKRKRTPSFCLGFIASFIFAGISCSFLQSLINLMSLMILYQFPFSCSNVATFYIIFFANASLLCLNMFTWANSLMATSITRNNIFEW